jgi:hypothetical protein
MSVMYRHFSIYDDQTIINSISLMMIRVVLIDAKWALIILLTFCKKKIVNQHLLKLNLKSII